MAVDAVGVGNVVRNSVASITTLIQVLRAPQPRKHIIHHVVEASQASAKMITALVGTIATVKKDGSLE